jgi:16S rRNA (uracil1498-N3)-methyltransferase
MLRLFLEFPSISNNKITISDKDKVHHIRDVLRLGENEAIIVFDKLGFEYVSRIEKLSSQNIILKIREKRNLKANKKFHMALACAIPKKSKMDDIIDKLTQLGVDRIIPLETKHVVVKLDGHKEILRQARWQKVAQSASQQCQRNSLPVVDAITDLNELLRESKDFDLKLIATLRGKRRLLKDALAGCRPENVLIVIGPEGDFSAREVDSAKNSGFIPVSLGELVLRVETAAIAVASYIRLLIL